MLNNKCLRFQLLTGTAIARLTEFASNAIAEIEAKLSLGSPLVRQKTALVTAY